MTETHDALVELADLFKELPETFTDEFKEVTPQAQLQGYRHLARLLMDPRGVCMISRETYPAADGPW
jgi:hypothetical protein